MKRFILNKNNVENIQDHYFESNIALCAGYGLYKKIYFSVYPFKNKVEIVVLVKKENKIIIEEKYPNTKDGLLIAVNIFNNYWGEIWMLEI